MTRVSFWQLGLYCVTAMLTPLPYNSLKFYCADKKLNLILFIDLLIALHALE